MLLFTPPEVAQSARHCVVRCSAQASRRLHIYETPSLALHTAKKVLLLVVATVMATKAAFVQAHHSVGLAMTHT